MQLHYFFITSSYDVEKDHPYVGSANPEQLGYAN